MSFNKKVAIVTGAGSGIGREISLELAQEGSIVVCIDANKKSASETEELISRKGVTSNSFEIDVRVKKDIDNMVDSVVNKFGTIDYLINCAGISTITPFLQHSESLWDQTLDVNLKGQFLMCQAVIPIMLKQESGSIVNMSSQSGKVGTTQYAAYCSSKFGVIGLTQSLAKEFGPNGIRVNSIAPGVVYTHMWEKQKFDYAKKRNLDPNHVMDYFKEKIPLRRLGTEEDVAKLTRFLLSDNASYITGQTINLNGGDIMF